MTIIMWMRRRLRAGASHAPEGAVNAGKRWNGALKPTPIASPLSSLGERHGFGDTLRRTTRMALVMASDGSSIYGQGVT